MSVSLRTRLVGAASNLAWLIAPVIVAQGRRVRRRIPRLPEASGPRSGEVGGDGPGIGWLVIGDSTAAGVGAHTQDNALGRRGATALSRCTGQRVHWQVLGRNGRNIAEVRRSLRALLPEARVDVVVVAVGVNDVTRWTTRRRFQRQLHGLLGDIRQRFGKPLVLVSGMPPVHRFPALPAPLRQAVGLRAHFVDRVLRESLAKSDTARYVPLAFADDPALFCSDGFHPGVEAYGMWADELVRQAMDAGWPGRTDRRSIP